MMNKEINDYETILSVSPKKASDHKMYLKILLHVWILKFWVQILDMQQIIEFNMNCVKQDRINRSEKAALGLNRTEQD